MHAINSNVNAFKCQRSSLLLDQQWSSLIGLMHPIKINIDAYHGQQS